MGCACEDGSRESFTSIILAVLDKPAVIMGLMKIKEKMPKAFYEETLRRVESAPDEQFSVTLIRREGDLIDEMTVGSQVFPQTLEWAKARVGKAIHVILTQLPNKRGGDLTMDVHDVSEESDL